MNIYDLFDSNKKPSKPTVSESRIEIIHEFAEDTDLFTSAGLNGVAATQDSDNVASPVGSGVEEAIETIRGREYPVDPGLYYVWAWDGAAVIYGEYNTPEQAEMHLPDIEQKAIKRVGPYVKGAFRVSDGRNLLRRYGVAVRDVAEHIVRVKGGYELKSRHGNKNLGKYPTKAGAEKRERQVQYFKHKDNVAETAPLSRDARRELVAPTDRDTVRRELWKYVRSLDQEGSSNRAHAMAYGCPTWGRLYRQFHNDVSQLLSRAPTELLAQALREIGRAHV